MKTVIVLALVLVLLALAGAGLFMVRKGGSPATRDSRMARALALRVGLSVLLFACILVSYWAGWIQPTGIPLGK